VSHPTAPPAAERLIVALDLPSADDARAAVRALGPSVSFYKIGLELFLAGGYFELADWLRQQGKKVFIDLKLFDVPQTVGSAVRRLAGCGAQFMTVHGNDAILRAACEASGPDGPGILAVTVLTSLDQADMEDLGFRTELRSVVRSRARRASELGCAGAVCSGHEVADIRAIVPDSFRLVVPGIRPLSAAGTDDQKRTVDVEAAIKAGADYLVMGRPIRGATDPRAMAENVTDRIRAIT